VVRTFRERGACRYQRDPVPQGCPAHLQFQFSIQGKNHKFGSAIWRIENQEPGMVGPTSTVNSTALRLVLMVGIASCAAAAEFSPDGQCDKTTGECISETYIELLLAVQQSNIEGVRSHFKEHGPYDTVKYGLERAASGITPTTLAARAGDVEMLQLLLANGGEQEVVDPAFDYNSMHSAIDGWNAARSRRE
jgi:hypothetical protein